jgi:hypothetical protein
MWGLLAKVETGLARLAYNAKQEEKQGRILHHHLKHAVFIGM